MKEIEAEQAHEFCKICGVFVEVHTHVVLGGGQFFSSCKFFYLLSKSKNML